MTLHDNKRTSNKIHFLNTKIFTDDGKLDWKQLIQKTLLLILFFLVVYAIGISFVRTHYHEIGLWVVKNLGFLGVGVFVFITDLIIVPMSVDLIFPFVLEYQPILLILVMSGASMLGGFGGYWIGRLLGHIPFIASFVSNFSSDGEKLVNRYGVWAVVIAGFTPIPFSTICWVTGMLRVNPYHIGIATLSRLPRMALYYAIFRGGLSFLF